MALLNGDEISLARRSCCIRNDRAPFPDRTVFERDETSYLLRSPANRARLLEAVTDIDQSRNIVVPDQEQFQ